MESTQGQTPEEYYRWYNGSSGNTVDNPFTIGNVFDWLGTQDTNGNWVTGYGTDYRRAYGSAVEKVGILHGIDVFSVSGSYESYRSVIETYPNEIDEMFEREFQK